jgi:hypothetical protein
VSMYADRYTTNHFSLTDPNVSDATAILRTTQERSAHHNLHLAVGHLCSSIPGTGLIAAPHHFLTSGRSPALAIRGHLEASMILSIAQDRLVRRTHKGSSQAQTKLVSSWKLHV